MDAMVGSTEGSDVVGSNDGAMVGLTEGSYVVGSDDGVIVKGT